jgi:hypothetical protein
VEKSGNSRTQKRGGRKNREQVRFEHEGTLDLRWALLESHNLSYASRKESPSGLGESGPGATGLR